MTVPARVARDENRLPSVPPAPAAPVTPIGSLGKPVGAVAAAAQVLRALHAATRPLNASEVARAAGLYRGTAYNILRTLQAEGFVSYDEASRTYAVSLHILELAYGVLRRSGLIDIARPLMHAVADAHGVSVYLSKVLAQSSILLLDWVGGLRPDPHITVGRPHPSPAGASGVIIAAFGNSAEPELEALLSQVDGMTNRPLSSSWRGSTRRSGPASRSTAARYRGVTLGSVPALSPSWELSLILTAAGHSHDLDDKAVEVLSRALQSAAGRLSDTLPLLRLG